MPYVYPNIDIFLSALAGAYQQNQPISGTVWVSIAFK